MFCLKDIFYTITTFYNVFRAFYTYSNIFFISSSRSTLSKAFDKSTKIPRKHFFSSKYSHIWSISYKSMISSKTKMFFKNCFIFSKYKTHRTLSVLGFLRNIEELILVDNLLKDLFYHSKKLEILFKCYF